MTTDQQADRLACPFCNCIVLGHCGFHMFCIRCGAEGPDSDEEDEQSAIEAWNRRATLARTPSVPDDVAADAARYRWLRAQVQSGPLTIAKSDPWELQPWSGDDPDGRIDAARASHEGEQHGQ